ncbi:uncharacterized aarF domain-containing protein kinase 5 isoform X3 [Chamaea fasciata]|uniref:uncharacterized aarF domain-containing protein kinase 5 isoform X2 n=1 Tax=Chamaea fasciata TaxID=190680 RepID=UPI00336A60E2
MHPDFALGWVLQELKGTLALELDFENEARNSERCGRDLGHLRGVTVPRVHWGHCSKRVLTADFCDGCKITNVEGIRELGLGLRDTAEKLIQVFAEQIFYTGFIHADPHPGNVLVRRGPDGKAQLVLLDHGLYETLSERDRASLCGLWRAIVLRDRDGMRERGAGTGGARLLPVLGDAAAAPPGRRRLSSPGPCGSSPGPGGRPRPRPSAGASPGRRRGPPERRGAALHAEHGGAPLPAGAGRAAGAAPPHAAGLPQHQHRAQRARRPGRARRQVRHHGPQRRAQLEPPAGGSRGLPEAAAAPGLGEPQVRAGPQVRVVPVPVFGGGAAAAQPLGGAAAGRAPAAGDARLRAAPEAADTCRDESGKNARDAGKNTRNSVKNTRNLVKNTRNSAGNSRKHPKSG